jgi:hypothetical protein
LEYASRRWGHESAFPSHAGNRRRTGPPTEAQEDLFAGPQHTLTLRGNLGLQELCRKQATKGKALKPKTVKIAAVAPTLVGLAVLAVMVPV